MKQFQETCKRMRVGEVMYVPVEHAAGWMAVNSTGILQGSVLRVRSPQRTLVALDNVLVAKPQQKWTISPSGMPASKGIPGDEEIWQIVDYIRHLPPKGSLGEPDVYTK